MASPVWLLLFVVVGGFLQSAAQEDDVCKWDLEGEYYDASDKDITAKLVVKDRRFHGTHRNGSQTQDILGRFQNKCVGDVIFKKTRKQVAFSLNNKTLSWSDGTHWTKKGEEVSEDDFQAVVYTGGSHRVSTTVACMIFGFFFAAIVLIYLVNSQTPRIRYTTFKMINAAMSVFCAIMLNQLVTCFLFEQLIKGEEGRGLGQDLNWKNKFLVSMGYTVIAWFVMNLLCWFVKEDARFRDGFVKMGSQILGFAAMGMSQALIRVFNKEGDDEGGSLEWTFMSLVLVFVFMQLVLANLGRVLRDKLSRGETANDKMQDKHSLAKYKLMDARSEAFALAASFLLAILCCQLVLGKLPHPERGHEDTTKEHVKGLFYAAIGFGFFAMLLRLVTRELPTTESCVTSSFLLLVDTFAMCSSWLFHLASLWATDQIFDHFHIFGGRLVPVAHAGAVISVGVVVYRLGDCLAQYLATDTVMKNKDIGDGLAIFLDSVAFFMANSWDEAFDSAEHTLAEFLETECGFNHPVVLRAGLAGFFVSVSIAGWLWFVVPAAKKSIKLHKLDIERAKRQAERWQRGVEGMDDKPTCSVCGADALCSVCGEKDGKSTEPRDDPEDNRMKLLFDNQE